MKSFAVILLLLLSPFSLSAQADPNFSKYADEKNDSLKKKNFVCPPIPPRELIIKLKDAVELNRSILKEFKIVDDSSNFTAEELASGLTEEELKAYRKNKDDLRKILKPPDSEEKLYPEISTLRKILNIAKTAGVIIILLLSLF